MRKSENKTKIPKSTMSKEITVVDASEREVIRKSGDRCKSSRSGSRQKNPNNGQESWGRDSGARDLSPDTSRMENSASTGAGDHIMMDNDLENVSMFDLASKVSPFSSNWFYFCIICIPFKLAHVEK